MTFPLVFVVLLTNLRGLHIEFDHSKFLAEGDNCTLPFDSQGICRRLHECPEVAQKIKDRVEPKICAFEKFESIVCCPIKPDTRPSVLAGIPQAVAATTSTEIPAFTPLPNEVIRVNTVFNSQQACEQNYRILQQVKNNSITGDCEEFYYDGPGVVGGEPAFPREFPHMAALGVGPENSIDWICGGSLISSRFVLTAAHCVVPMRSRTITWVRLGDLDLSTSTDDARPQQFSVAERIAHPEYNYPSLYNDIALLRLDRDVQFTPYVLPACLNIEADVLDNVGDTAGWGLTHFAGSQSSTLQKATLPVQPKEECERNFHSSKGTNTLERGFDDSTMLCVGDRQGEMDTCQGDSGGPYQRGQGYRKCVPIIVGLTSFGKAVCGAVNSPAVYTRVSAFIPWIESVVWPQSPARTF